MKESFSNLHLQQHFLVLHLEDEVDGAVVVRLQLVFQLVVDQTLFLKSDERRSKLTRRFLRQKFDRKRLLVVAQRDGVCVKVDRVHL